jgi:hypothetical protein
MSAFPLTSPWLVSWYQDVQHSTRALAAELVHVATCHGGMHASRRLELWKEGRIGFGRKIALSALMKFDL